MKPKEILKEIVNNNGRCTAFADLTICERCPMGVRATGKSCWETIIESKGVFEELDVDTLYKKAAYDKLADMEIEEWLTPKTSDGV